MNSSRIQITDYDLKMLKKLTNKSQSLTQLPPQLVEQLESLIENAIVIEQKAAPPYLVTMNSCVNLIDLADKAVMDCWLVYPEEATQRQNNISVVSDLGMAIIGRKTGDEFKLVENSGEKQYRITGISYQPEANNHYKL